MSISSLTGTEQAVDSVTGLTEKDLEHFEETFLEPREKEMTARMVFPVAQDIPSWAKTTEYNKVIDRNYRANFPQQDQDDQFHSSEETDIPLVSQNVQRRSNRILRRYLGFKLEANEVEKAEQLGMDVNDEGAELLRKGHRYFLERLVWLGSNLYGIPGVANASAVQTVSPTTDGSGNTEWSIKADSDGHLILRDFDKAGEALINKPGFEPPFNYAVSLEEYGILSTSRIAPDSAGDTRTILEVVMESPLVNDIWGTSYLDDQGASNTGMLVAVAAETNNVDVILPNVEEMLEPWELANENILLRSKQTTGGLRIKDDQAIVRMENI